MKVLAENRIAFASIFRVGEQKKFIPIFMAWVKRDLLERVVLNARNCE